MEGIHGLNPLFTRELPQGSCVKLYVSVKQQIKSANGDVISPMDLRLVRRIVRDVQFRDTTPERTLSMWDQVVEGEDRYIRPYRLSADYTVNSIHIYEPCVMRTVAIPLLRAIAEDSPYYRKARDLEARLMRFEPISASLGAGELHAPGVPGPQAAQITLPRVGVFLFFRQEAPRFFTKNTKSKGIVSDLKGKML